MRCLLSSYLRLIALIVVWDLGVRVTRVHAAQLCITEQIAVGGFVGLLVQKNLSAYGAYVAVSATLEDCNEMGQPII